MTLEVGLLAIAGDTYSHTVRWADGDLLVKKAITGVSKAGIAVVTAVGHDLANGWPFTIQSVQGMEEINNEILRLNSNGAPVEFGYGANGELSYKASSVAADTVALNDVNSLDFGTYTAATGVLVYNSPKSLAGATAKLMVKDEPEDETANFTLTETAGIVIDDSAHTIIFTISAAQTLALGVGKFYYDLQITVGGVVTTIIKGFLEITDQVTT